MEVAQGIHRIESVLGPRPFSQYLLRGERSLLVDTGIVSTPAEVILPYFAEIGLDPADLDLILISHADVDHFGGTAAVRAAAPRALICGHGLDAGWIDSGERILRERYGWYAEHGPFVDYDEATKVWLREALGADVPVDLELQGGERIRLGPDLTTEVLHLPGHSPGHIGLWEPRSRTAIVTDAVLGAGLLDTEGAVIQPPPYFEVAAYEATIGQLQELRPERLLTAHYPVIEGADVADFLATSADFVARARRTVATHLDGAGELDLAGLYQLANPELGPFTAMPGELCGTLQAHLEELEAAGLAERVAGADPPRWRSKPR